MAIDDNFEIDLDDGVHALVGHPDHDASGPLDSDASGYRPTEDHNGGASGHGGSHHGRDSDSHGSHRGKRSHDSDDADHSHKAKHTQKVKHSDDDSDRSDESARPKDRHGSRSHDSDDADHSHKAKRSHDSDDAEHSQRAKHPRKDKHSDDSRDSHEAKRSHDSDDAEHSQKAKHAREDKHSDDSRDSHEAKRSHDSDDAEHSQRAKHPREDKHSDDSRDSGHWVSRQADGTVHDTANPTRAPLSSSGDVADDLIAAAYGTAPGNLGTAAAARPSFPQVDTSELVKGAPREEPATGQTTSGDEQPYVLREDTAPTPDPVAVALPANPYPTPADTNAGAAAPGPVANAPAQVPLVAAAPPPPPPASAPVSAPSSPPAVTPQDVEVLETDANGVPTHVRLTHPVNTTTMVTMGGNNPGYVNGQPAVGYINDHFVSSVPINPSQTIFTMTGILKTGPGGEIDTGPVMPQNLGPSSSSSASVPGGGAPQPLPPKQMFPTSDGQLFDNPGDQARHQEALRQGQDPYEGPTVRRGP